MADTKPTGSTPTPDSNGGQAGKIDLSITPNEPKPAAPAQPAAPTPAPSATAPKPAEPAKAPTPAPTPEPKAAEDKGGLSFTNIFNEQKEKKKETKVISSVLKKEGKTSKIKPILGTAPALQKSIEEDRKTKLKRKVRLVQIAFVIVFLAGAASAFYFYQELSPTFDLFGQNTTQRLATVNDNLRSVQTQVNKYRYLAAQLDLNRFSHVSDQFLDKTAQLGDAAPGQMAALQQTIAQAGNDLPALLSNIREQLTPEIVVQTTRSEAEEELTPDQIRSNAETDLRNALLADRRAITANSSLTKANEEEIKLIDNTIKLVGNTPLLNTIRSASVENFQEELANYVSTLDPGLRISLSELMESVLTSTQSSIATIGSIKANRIEWSTIMKQIEDVTRVIDPAFGAGLTTTLGDGIFYTGYEFETTTNKITISGVSKTTTADNFTVISNLIEELERSPNFENVEMRSFSKSGTFAQGFTSAFKIDLALEVNGFSDQNSPISLESRRVARVSGVARN